MTKEADGMIGEGLSKGVTVTEIELLQLKVYKISPIA